MIQQMNLRNTLVQSSPNAQHDDVLEAHEWPKLNYLTSIVQNCPFDLCPDA